MPRDTLKAHCDVVLTGDVFFLQGHLFLVTLLHVIKFNAVKDSFDVTIKNLEVALERVFNLCSRRGFRIRDSPMDMQFEPVHNFCSKQGINRNVCLADEHVTEIECFVRTLKERVGALRASLPFKTILKRVAMTLVRHASEWLNVFARRMVLVRWLVCVC